MVGKTNDNSILAGIESPENLKALNTAQLKQLCGEIRALLIDSVSKTGGHLASNLGTVELTVAMHCVFDTPQDEFVWDVGHQCYTHKILTGRADKMYTMRQEGGLSGFPKPSESEHDSFISGHSSTSISVADGISRAKHLRGEDGHVVAVIGDGAFTGGMAYEGLNNIVHKNRNVIVILNDNKMSISKNVGSITRYLDILRNKPSYFRLKDITKSALKVVPLVGKPLISALSSIKSWGKGLVYKNQSSFFEELGFIHMGPVDGHDLNMLKNVLKRAKAQSRPVLIHVETLKGKGYSFAEENPGAYHGVGSFDPEKGSMSVLPSEDSYSAVFGRQLVKLAEADNRICAATAAMKYATGLHYFYKQPELQDRFFDFGIAEQHATTFCAALASKGFIPVFAVYSSFLQRAYDQILHDCAITRQHVIFAVDRAGFVGDDGETHQGLFDCAYLSAIPGVSIYAPCCYNELERCLERAVNDEDGVVAVRYPRGAQPPQAREYNLYAGSYTHCDNGRDILFVTYGREYFEVQKAVEQLSQSGISASILKLTKVYPVDLQAVRIATAYPCVIFAEEGIRSGGIAEHFLVEMMLEGYKGEAYICAVNDTFVAQAKPESQLRHYGLDGDGLAGYVLKLREERKSS